MDATANGNHKKVLIIGGGSGGISVAARVRRALGAGQVGVIEPSDKHYYQPLWTLVGGGVTSREVTEHDEASVIPSGVDWIRDAAASFDPAQRTVHCVSGKSFTYDTLVIAAGIQLDWDKIKGLRGHLGRDGICSNYSYESVESTWRAIRDFKGGRAVFTHPATPIKCGGAPQKIMYLAADHFRRTGIADRSEIVFGIASPTIFAVKRYADTLLEVVERYGIDVRYGHDLTEVRPTSKEAVFRRVDGSGEVVLKYDLLHVTPPMSAPDFLKQSPFADAAGWVDVHRDTLQHNRYAEVFALGDASNLPTSKTGAAIRKQAPVLVKNLLAFLKGQPLTARYDGYTSCPLVTGYGKLVMAEFDYNQKAAETFPFDQSKERYSMYQLKRYLLPLLYWKGMLKGRF